MALLTDRLEDLCAALMAGRVEGHEWVAARTRDGGLGDSLRVELKGAKRGVWGHFASGAGGDALALIAHVNGTDTTGAIRWAKSFLGLAGMDPAEARRQQALAAERRADLARRAEAEARRKLDDMRHIWLAAGPLIGSPAELYLAGRGIDVRRLAKPPSALRFHPRLYCAEADRPLPALVAAIHGGDEKAALHRTWLAERRDGSWGKAALREPKKTLGRYGGGSIRLARGASGRPLKQAPCDDLVLVSEGIEDGLSAARLVPEARVLAAVSLSNIAGLWLPDQLRAVTLVGQNDEGEAAPAAFARAVAALQRRGLTVRVARPPAGIKDFNDWLRERPAGRDQTGERAHASNDRRAS